MALNKEQTEDEISQLCSGILEYKIGTYEEFHDARAGEMEGCRLNAAVFGMTGSGKSALINTIFRSLGIESEPAIIQDAGKEGTKMAEPYAVPGTDITLFDTRGFFEMDRTEEGKIFLFHFECLKRISRIIHRKSDYYYYVQCTLMFPSVVQPKALFSGPRCDNLYLILDPRIAK